MVKEPVGFIGIKFKGAIPAVLQYLLETAWICARTGRVGQAHTDLFVLSTNHILWVITTSERSHEAKSYH